MFFRSSFVALVAIASLTVSVNGQGATCPSTDKAGAAVASSTPADSDGLITCTYTGAPGACQYFANGDGLSSGSSDCPDITASGGGGGGGASSAAIPSAPGPASISASSSSSSASSAPATTSAASSSSAVSSTSSGFITTTSSSAPTTTATVSSASSSAASTTAASSSAAASSPAASNAAYSVQPGVISGAGVGAVAILLSFL